MNFDVAIRNGQIIDGTGNPWFKADIGINDGRIAKISSLPLKQAQRTIDANGLLICPGFINLHSHSDATILSHNNAENCLAMGLVTEGVGNCGSSVAPITEKSREALRQRIMRRTLGEVDVDWFSLSEWISRVEEKGIGINIASYIGHGAVRSSVMGLEGEGGERVTPTEDEMKEMKTLVNQAMKDGAFGLSTGLIYAPGRNALTQEVIELCKVVAKYGGLYASHMRDEGDKLLEAVWEFTEICEKAGVRGVIAHTKSIRRRNYGKSTELIRLVDKARTGGINIILDQYPWQIGGTTKSLGGRFRPDVKTRKELVEKLKDPIEWEKLKASALERREKELKLYEKRKRELEEKGGWATPYSREFGGIILYSKAHPELEWKSFQEVAEALGSGDLWEGIRRLLIDDEGWTSAGGEPYSEDDIITILSYPWTTVSTDQYAMDNTKASLQDNADNLTMQNPRGWGTYAKILGKYVREVKVLTLEEAIRKMTSLPAQFLGLQDRGLVKEGFWADLVVFNPETVENQATYANPHLFPKGIPYVLVNGEVAIDKGKHTGALAGKVLLNNA
jgi:N-acyl-D-amino-acid deacylase